jgi:Tol biopolymer transport system component/class 3 adenylate cyclase
MRRLERDVMQAGDTRRLTTILAIDVVGYSAAAERDQVRAIGRINALRARIAALAEEHGGRIFNTAGDGFMLEFPLASGAVRAAIALLNQTTSPESELPPVRAGAHLGEVMVEGQDLMGHGVNVAARLAAQAEPNGLVIADAVKTQLRGEVDAPFTPLGLVKLSKMREPIAAHAYAPGGADGWRRRRLLAIAQRRWPVLAGAGVIAAILAAGGVIATQPRGYVFEPMQMVAHSRRAEFQPALSPDGRFIAYVVNYGTAHDYQTELVMRTVSGGEETALTDTDDYNEFLPAFSPAGDRLAYLRRRNPEEGHRCEIMVRDFPNGLDRRVGGCEGSGSNRIGWTVDGRAIVFTDSLSGGDETSRIRELDLETGATRDLVPPPPRGMGDRAPAMSPDGTRVAFVRYDTPERGDVFVWNTQSQRLTRVTNRNAWAQTAWADPRNLFVITLAESADATELSLWRADGRGSAQSLLPGLTQLTHPVTAQGVLALQVEAAALNLVRSGERGVVPITEGNQIDDWPDFSHDGTLAFISHRSGTWIYLQAPGEQPRRLAELTDRNPSGLRWSPDGLRLAFSGQEDGQSRLFTVDAASGVVQPVRLDLDEDVANPAWSADGESLIFASTHPQGPRLMRLRLDSTTPEPISGPGWIAAIQTREGLFAIRREQPGIWRLAPGREPELAFPGFRFPILSAVLLAPRRWSVSNGRFYLLEKDDNGQGRIRYRAIAGGPTVHVTDLDHLSGGQLAVDPTTGDVVYQVAVDEPQSDIAIMRYRRR